MSITNIHIDIHTHIQFHMKAECDFVVIGENKKMPPRRTYNERRARVHLTKKRAHEHERAHNVYVVPINVLRIFSYPKFCCLIFFYDKN